ncbi:ankyrin repeat domain-containing protein [Sphingobacterium sp. LRF_L2]|uniref:ankyrin repeat domain-containing protein n=1 Tax=Sphingobacterium sp. LRF_L2 TaxID=3369421 RepID=UPI003F624DEF
MRYFLVIIIFLCYSCEPPLPGFDFDLFKGTPGEKLANAVRDQSEKKIKEILSTSNISPDIREPIHGRTLLMLAIANNLEESVKFLLEAGADPNIRTGKAGGDVLTPMLLACNHIYRRRVCDLDVLETLIAYKGNVNDSVPKQFLNADYQSLNTPLLEACKGDCLELVKLLVDNRADINNYDYREGIGPLSYAIMFNNLETLRYLIIDRKIKIPKYCCIIQAYAETPRIEMTVEESLMDNKYEKGSKNDRMRSEIISYLQGNR